MQQPAQSLEANGFPDRRADTEHRVRLRMLGLLPMGTQLIALRDETRADGTRIVHDEGGPLTGAMSIVSRWHHRMAINPDPAAPDSRTPFRDALYVGAGVLTPVVWFGFWVFWQLRAQQLRPLAPGWAV